LITQIKMNSHTSHCMHYRIENGIKSAQDSLGLNLPNLNFKVEPVNRLAISSEPIDRLFIRDEHLEICRNRSTD